MHHMTESFTEALHALHADRDVGQMVALFSEDASLTKLGDQQAAEGRDGAKRFWQDYRSVFDEIEATFTHVIQDDGLAALEWTSTGSLASGASFRYDGVSVLEGDEQGIRGFRTYYDTAAFVKPSPARRAGT